MPWITLVRVHTVAVEMNGMLSSMRCTTTTAAA